MKTYMKIKTFAAIACAGCLVVPDASAQGPNLCANVRIQVQKKMKLKRRTFVGQLTVSNGLAHFEAGDSSFQEPFDFEGASKKGSLSILGSGVGQFNLRMKRRKNPKMLLVGRARFDYNATVDGSQQPLDLDGRGRLHLRGKLVEGDGACLKGMLKLRDER